MLNDTESYFNNGIKQAVKAGDIDKALKLMNEAEKLGSTTARKTFISSVKGKGNTRRCRCWLDDWCALAHLFSSAGQRCADQRQQTSVVYLLHDTHRLALRRRHADRQAQAVRPPAA